MPQAIELFSKVIAAAPHHTRALERRLECHLSLGDYATIKVDSETLLACGDEQAREAASKATAEARRQLNMPAREVLGLPLRAPAGMPSQAEAEVKKAYRQLCLQFHPDKHAASSPEMQVRAKHRFARIQAAYEKLIKPSASPSYRNAYGF